MNYLRIWLDILYVHLVIRRVQLQLCWQFRRWVPRAEVLAALRRAL